MRINVTSASQQTAQKCREEDNKRHPLHKDSPANSCQPLPYPPPPCTRYIAGARLHNTQQ